MGNSRRGNIRPSSSLRSSTRWSRRDSGDTGDGEDEVTGRLTGTLRRSRLATDKSFRVTITYGDTQTYTTMKNLMEKREQQGLLRVSKKF